MRMKWEAAKKWCLVIGLAEISAMCVVSSRLRRLSPMPYPSSNRCVAGTGCSVFIVSIILSNKIPIHKNISVFQLIISWHISPAGQSASTNTVREPIRAKTGEFLA